MLDWRMNLTRHRETGGRQEGQVSRLVSAELKDRSSHYYSVADNGRSITCHLCGCVSRDPHDVRERYCPRCRVFHEDRLLMLRLDQGYSSSYHSPSETVSLLHVA